MGQTGSVRRIDNLLSKIEYVLLFLPGQFCSRQISKTEAAKGIHPG